jgi:tol-pal system protein YbgF
MHAHTSNFSASPLVRVLAYTSFFVLLMLLGVSPSRAQDASALIDKVQRLERQLSTLERQIYRGDGSKGAHSTSDLPSSGHQNDVSYSSSQIGTLEKEIQRLTSNLEEASHEISTLKKELLTLKNDLEFRIAEIEKKASISSEKPKLEHESKESKKEKTEPTEKKLEHKKEEGSESHTTLETPSEKGMKSKPKDMSKEMPSGAAADQYNESLDLLKKKEYAAAQKGFESFLENNKDHDLAGNAQYWLGETHDALGDHTKASVAYLSSFKKGGSKAAESLLKLGQSLAKLGKGKEACATFQKLLSDFPKASETVRKAAEDARSKNQCS